MTVEVQAVGEIPSYSIIEGANGVWIQNSDGILTFRANGDFSKFTGVKVDGTLIDVKNYAIRDGEYWQNCINSQRKDSFHIIYQNMRGVFYYE